MSGPEHPPSPDYVHGPKEPEQAPLSPDYVPEPEYPEYLAPSDAEAPMEDQPLRDDASPTTLSPGYVADSNPEEDPEEALRRIMPTILSMEETIMIMSHPTMMMMMRRRSRRLLRMMTRRRRSILTNSSVVPVDDHVPSAEDTEAFKTDESVPTLVPSLRRCTARMSVRPQTPMPSTAKALITEYASAPTPPSPPPSPLSPLSSTFPHIPSPPLPLPSPPTHTSPTYAEAPLGYRTARIQLRAASPSTHHPSEIPSPPLLLPSTTHREDLPEADMPLQKRARFIAPTGRFEVRESSSAAAARQAGHTQDHRVDYGFLHTEDTSIRASESRAMTTIGEVIDRVINLATTQRQDA
ncbi:hypothetical protein Tco_1315055 [Tanacetum coccineum]